MHRPALLTLCLAATPALLHADETRQLGAHAHGIGQLNIAFEAGEILIELHAPGADIVGFEHAPESPNDRAAIAAGLAALSKPLELFAVPDDAGCAVITSTAELESEGPHDHGDHGHEDHGGADDHDDHAHGDGHDEHKDDHEHEYEYAGEAQHSEFHAEYTLACDAPDAITEIDFAYFSAFPNAQRLEVQMISETGSKGFDVTSDAPKLELGRSQ